MSRRPVLPFLFMLVIVALARPAALLADPLNFAQINLVSNGAVPAPTIDPSLKNPWGLSFGPTTPYWVANAGTGLSTLYSGTGVKQALTVTVPPPPGSPVGTTSSPTGSVFNGGSNFQSDRFLFATEDGTIAGWQGSLGTTAATRADKAASGAVYKGLAINSASDRIYATNFSQGSVDIFNGSYTQLFLPAAFLDPNLPSGYAPFGIQQIGGTIYVTFAKREAGGDDDEAGPGFGFVDAFDANGVLLRRVVTGVPGDPNSPLNSPWGLALAPAGFGSLTGSLLVGNFGNGRINAFDPLTGLLLGTLLDRSGNPIVIPGLWSLQPGNTGAGSNPQAVYFTAGINGEEDGLFGQLEAVPEPGTMLLVGTGLLLRVVRRKPQRRVEL